MSIRSKALICFVAIAAVVFSFVSLADVCRVQQVSYPVYGYQYQQPVLLKQIYQPYYYAVGTELQLDALAERLAQRLEQKQKLAEKLRPKTGILNAKCAACHTAGTKAVMEDNAPVYFDAVGNLTATQEQRASMATAAKLGVMPPAKELSDEEWIEFKVELGKQPLTTER